MRRGAAILLLAGACCGVAVAEASAQARSSTGLPGSPGLNSNLPIDVTAEQTDAFREQHLYIYKGNVEAIQGNVRVRTPQLDIYTAVKPSAPNGSAPGLTGAGGIERMELAGPVYYVTPTETAKGDHGTYLKAPDTITLTGNVILTQDKNVLTGEKLVVEQKTGHSTLTSSHRVRTIIYPQQPAAANAPKPAAAAPAPAGPTRPAARPASAPAAAKKRKS